MTMTAVQYLLPENWGIPKGVDLLTRGLSTEVMPESRVDLIFHDSFDWRLYNAGLLLGEESGDGERRLWLSGLNAVQPELVLPQQGKVPAFPADLPDSPLRERLSGLLSMRALIPQVEIRLNRTEIRLLDDERKTLLRMYLDECEAGEAGSRSRQSFGLRLTLLPLKGYASAVRAMQRHLQEEFELEESAGCLLDQALAVLDRRPDDYSSKLDFRLEPQERADSVAKQIHLHLLNTLERNIAGTRADIDSEFLHDLRVAVRRSRSALSQIKGVFTEEEVERFKTRLGWIGQITGPTRDMDVYLLGFPEYRQSLPSEYQEALEPLHRFLIAHQRSEHRALVRKLDSPHFRTLLKEWREFLEAPVAEVSSAPKGNLPVKEVADKRIYRMFKRVLDEGLAIDTDSPHEMLHELRKSCKKLRYLLEFFQSLYPPREVKRLVKELKVLLDNLGEFQDLEVQSHKLREFSHQMSGEGEVPPDTLLAMGMLVDGLIKRQMAAREAFARLFTAFASDEIQSEFKRLFAAGKQPTEAQS